VGVGFLLFLDEVTPHMHLDNTEEGPKENCLSRSMKLILAVTLHNIPEGMAVGVVYAGWLNGNSSIIYFGALALALDIAIQNFPEGAIVSMPLRAERMPKWKTFVYGVLSGLVEPIGSIITILFGSRVVSLILYFLKCAVIVELQDILKQLAHSHFVHQQYNLRVIY